mgnify:CR=1 FL=1
MKVIILGADGQLGTNLTSLLKTKYQVFFYNKRQLNLLNKPELVRVISNISPNVIINAAAYTKVDLAEKEKDLVFKINFESVKDIAKLASDLGIYFIHYSTDYVFDGEKKSPYVESDQPNPINIYGQSKLLGEESIASLKCNYLIFRTSWNVGIYGNNFVKSIINLAKNKNEIGVVVDQRGVPTTTSFIARVTLEAIDALQKKMPWSSGIYHLTPSGLTNWYEMSKLVLISANKNNLKLKTNIKNLFPILSANYDTVALRPKNSLLNSKKLSKKLTFKIPNWKDDFIETVNKIILTNVK